MSHQDIVGTSASFFSCLNAPPTLYYAPVRKSVEKNRSPHLFYGLQEPGKRRQSWVLHVAYTIRTPRSGSWRYDRSHKVFVKTLTSSPMASVTSEIRVACKAVGPVTFNTHPRHLRAYVTRLPAAFSDHLNWWFTECRPYWHQPRLGRAQIFPLRTYIGAPRQDGGPTYTWLLEL